MPRHPRLLARAALLASLATLGACGLFQSEPALPTALEIEEARARQEGQWARLERALSWLREDPIGGWARVEDLRARFPDDVRLAALVQDLRIEQQGIEAVRRVADRRHAEQPTALHAYLAARVAADKERQAELVAQALALDPGLEQAEVLKLALEARAGEAKTLERLIRLLRRHPGLAEGWRLLGELASLYARPDLALRAEQTEPWSSFDDPLRSRLALAAAEVAGGASERALELLAALPAEDPDAAILRAAAHVAAGRPVPARDLLAAVIDRDPHHAIAHFNLGLLFRDYLNNPAQAQLHLQRYLDTADLPAEQDLFRRIQAEFWLAQYRSAAATSAP